VPCEPTLEPIDPLDELLLLLVDSKFSSEDKVPTDATASEWWLELELEICVISDSCDTGTEDPLSECELINVSSTGE
jgi:hypothetical protein